MRGRPGCPTEQEKNSVEATGGAPLFLFLQGKVGYRIAPHPPQWHWGTFPQGKALGVGMILPSVNPPPQPAQLGAGRYGRRDTGPQARQKKEDPAGSPQTRKGGSREEEPLPPGVFPPAFFQRKPGSPPESAGKPRRRAHPALVQKAPNGAPAG